MVYGHRSNGSSQPDLNGARCADHAHLSLAQSIHTVTLLAGCGAALVGYSLVLYLPIRNGIGPGFHWGDLSGWGEVWDHLTGATYRGSFRASHGGYAAQRRAVGYQCSA